MRCGRLLPLAHLFYFFFNDTATTEIYTLSLHDALPIYSRTEHRADRVRAARHALTCCRSEEHTSELQSHVNLVCRLLLENKNKIPTQTAPIRATSVNCKSNSYTANT